VFWAAVPGKSWCLDSISRSTSATSGIISSVAPPACCSACSSRPLSVPAERRLPSLPYHEPCDLLRSATVRILSPTVSGGQDPDRPPTPGGTRRRNRLLCHDSDHDPRETQTILRDRRTGAAVLLNFPFENKLQRKFSPLFLKRVPAGWRDHTARQLPVYVEEPWVDAFRTNPASTVAGFCSKWYQRMACSTASESCARAIRPFAAPPAMSRTSLSTFLIKARSCARGRPPALGGCTRAARPTLISRSPNLRRNRLAHPRHAPALDAIRGALHHYVAGPGEQAYCIPRRLLTSSFPLAIRSTAPMKPTPTSLPSPKTLLAFGAHPDDIEFGCGGVIARETQAGGTAHLVVCSRGESATNGTPAQRTKEAKQGAGCSARRSEFIDLAAMHALRRTSRRPAAGRHHPPRASQVVLAPTPVENQHRITPSSAARARRRPSGALRRREGTHGAAGPRHRASPLLCGHARSRAGRPPASVL